MNNIGSIGFIGLGKLGLPCAAAMSVKTGSKIYGYDLNTHIYQYIKENKVPYVEEGIEQYLSESNIEIKGSINDIVINSEIIFVAVQTPHEERFEGISPIPNDTADFDYKYLKSAITDIKESAIVNNKNITVVIISTVLPGTIRREILPIIEGYDSQIKIVYNPYFIAMGTTIQDFLNPEFVLLGVNNNDTNIVRDIYNKFITKPILNMSYESAELVKVSYNTFIGMKIVFANTLAEITEKIGGDVDDVTMALSLANDRIISNKYLSAGMGDGGGCHPRDQIAMSWLAKKINLSFNLFESIAQARDSQTKYHADIIESFCKRNRFEQDQEVIILGESYKKNIGIRTGSPSRLLQHYLNEKDIKYKVIDPHIWDIENVSFSSPKVFFVATPHDAFKNLSVPHYSVIIDPWGNTIPKQYGVDIINLGRRYFGKNI